MPGFVMYSEWQKDKPQELPEFDPSKAVNDILEGANNTNTQNQKKVNDGTVTE